MSSRSTDKSKVAFSTRAGTGRTIHAQAIDTRTVWARRGRELYIAIMSDLGGQDRLSELEIQLVRRAVGLAIQCEQNEVLLAEGKQVDMAAACTAINAFNRTASLIGLKRRAKDVTPHLETYLAERYACDEDR